MRHVTGAVSAIVLLMSSLTWAAGPEPANDEQKTLYALGVALSQSLEPFTLNETELEFVRSGLTEEVMKAAAEGRPAGVRSENSTHAASALSALADVEKKPGPDSSPKPPLNRARKTRSRAPSSPRSRKAKGPPRKLLIP